MGHNDDIKSMAMCPSAVNYKGAHYEAKTLFATGQVTVTMLARDFLAAAHSEKTDPSTNNHSAGSSLEDADAR